MDMSLTSDQEAVRKAVKQWVDDVVVPRSLSNDREERFPQEALDGLKQTGFIGMTIPEEYGGGGADPISYLLLIEELGRGDANVRSIVSVHLGLVAGVIDRMGTEQQKQRWLPQMATGEVLACFGLTEPDFGSDAGNLAGTAVKQEDGSYKINCRKIFITNGSIAGLALIMARTGGPGGKGVSAFLVPTDTPGFQANKIHGKLGLRSCDTAELVLDDVVVGEDALLGGVEGTGMKAAMSALGDGRMSIAASCTGIIQACLDSMIEYTTQREQFGKKIAAHQLVQELISDTAVLLDASRLMSWRAGHLKAKGEDYALASSKAKLFATEASVTAANNCIQAYGGYGYVDEYPGGKYLRDARVTTLYEGTSQIQKLIIGRALTGINAF